MPNEDLEKLADKLADKLIEDLDPKFLPGNLPPEKETALEAEARRAKLTAARKDAGVKDMSGLDKAAMLKNIQTLAGLPTSKKVGACGELAAYAYVNFAEQVKTYNTVYMFEAPNTKQKDDYHAYVVLCFKGSTSGTIDLSKDEDAIVVDLWMNYAVDGYGAVASGKQHADALKDFPYDLAKSKLLYPPS